MTGLIQAMRVVLFGNIDQRRISGKLSADFPAVFS
jgi:hypothetical protein